MTWIGGWLTRKDGELPSKKILIKKNTVFVNERGGIAVSWLPY